MMVVRGLSENHITHRIYNLPSTSNNMYMPENIVSLVPYTES